MLIASGGDEQINIAWVTERAGALGLLIRSLVGLDRADATYAFYNQPGRNEVSVEQVRFVSLIVDELTANEIMEPTRLYESPYTYHGHVDLILPNALNPSSKSSETSGRTHSPATSPDNARSRSSRCRVETTHDSDPTHMAP